MTKIEKIIQDLYTVKSCCKYKDDCGTCNACSSIYRVERILNLEAEAKRLKDMLKEDDREREEQNKSNSPYTIKTLEPEKKFILGGIDTFSLESLCKEMI